jgi:hypothetical protein
MTTGEAMLNALESLLQTAIPDADVKRNIPVPDRIVGRLIIIRDGKAVPEAQLGTKGPWYVTQRVPVELLVQVGDDTARDVAFNLLAEDVEAALQSDLTLGDLVYGMIWDGPEIDTEAFPGAAGVKAAVLDLAVDYQSDTRL